MPNKYMIVVVIRARIGEESGFRVVCIPRDNPDVTLVDEYQKDLPGDWEDHGLYRTADEAVMAAKWVDAALADAHRGGV